MKEALLESENMLSDSDDYDFLNISKPYGSTIVKYEFLRSCIMEIQTAGDDLKAAHALRV